MRKEKATGSKAATRKRKSRITLDEYRERFLQVPKIIDRKPVFVSGETRNRIDDIVRRIGGKGMSASGFIENLVRNHLDTYEKNIEIWRKL